MSCFKLLLFDSGLNKERKTVLALLHTFTLAIFRDAFGQLYEPKCILRTADLGLMDSQRLMHSHRNFTCSLPIHYTGTVTKQDGHATAVSMGCV